MAAEDYWMIYIPKGFAHGYQTLEDDTQVDYEITPAYVPSAATGIRFDDAILQISWPIEEKIVSQRDRNLPLLSELACKFE